MRGLLGGNTYSDLSVNGAALIREQQFFDNQRFLEEIW